MDDVFNDPIKEDHIKPQGEVQDNQAGETVEQTQDESAQTGAQGDAGATTAPENAKHVPLAALEATRREKQDWKERAIRAEERWQAAEAARQNVQGNGQPEQQQASPMEALQQQMLTERFNTSEMLARQSYEATDPNFQKMIDTFMDAKAKNPALHHELLQQRHPWEWAYKQGKRIAAMQEIGEDPAAYKERLRAELLAEMGQTPAAAPATSAAPAAQPLPQSLAGARSSATRQASTFTGPTPIGSLFVN